MMEAFKVKKDTWHHKLLFGNWQLFGWDMKEISIYDHRFGHTAKDFCTYWRSVVLWSIMMTFLITGTVGMLSALVGGWLVIFMGVFFGMAPQESMPVILASITAAVAIGLLIWQCLKLLWTGLSKTYDAIPSPEEDNIVRVKYRSWKDKHCPFINYEE